MKQPPATLRSGARKERNLVGLRISHGIFKIEMEAGKDTLL
jgi:hypothetical protein